MNITNLSARPAHIEPELWAKLKAIRARIDAKEIAAPTEHKSIVFDDAGAVFYGTYPASRIGAPTPEFFARARQERRPAFWDRESA